MFKVAKKILFALLFCFMLFVLTSCFTGVSSITYWPDEKVASIELINYENPNAIENPSESSPLDLGKIEVIEILDSEEIENFLEDLAIRVHMFYFRKQYLYSHDGIGLRISYEGNNFQLITLTEINEEYYFFIGIYDEYGTVIESKDACMFSATIEFVDAINKYFITQISLDEEYLE